MNKDNVVVSRKVIFPFILITSLFALWGFANDITNPLVAAFKTVMEISNAKAALIQFAFYGGYATMAIPAALFVKKYSYKKGILLGLAFICHWCTAVFPCSAIRNVWLFPGIIVYPYIRIGLLGNNSQSIYTFHGR